MTDCKDMTEKTTEWGAISTEKMTWDDAVAWCESQGEGWRLPRPSELLRAFEEGVDGFEGRPFWSSSSYAGSASNAWNVAFSPGPVSYDDKAYTYYARCVRVRSSSAVSVAELKAILEILDHAEAAGERVAEIRARLGMPPNPGAEPPAMGAENDPESEG